MRKITYEEYKQLAESVQGDWRKYWAEALGNKALAKVKDQVELGRIICEEHLVWDQATD